MDDHNSRWICIVCKQVMEDNHTEKLVSDRKDEKGIQLKA